MAAVAMAVGATAGAARAVVDSWRQVYNSPGRQVYNSGGVQHCVQRQVYNGRCTTPGVQHSWRQVYNSADRAVCPIGATRL